MKSSSSESSMNLIGFFFGVGFIRRFRLFDRDRLVALVDDAEDEFNVVGDERAVEDVK